jgi:hypothetical protein
MLPTVYPADIQVQHLVYVPDGGTDSRGNPTGVLDAPVIRQVIGFYRPGPQPDPISLDYMARTITQLVMLVYEPTLYNKLDQVWAYDGAEWLAYQVQNQPISWATGYPWRRYAALFGGEVYIRRVE